MRVVNLQAENIKRLVAVDITPKEDMVVITGENGAGKSSVLDSIYYALGGASIIDSEPVRKGTEKGSVRVDLGEYIVTRTFSKKNTYLKIESKDGQIVKSPQKLLDEIVGAVSFDPLAFINIPDIKEQRQILLNLIGVDTDALDKDEKELREKRTLVGRDRDKAESLLKSLTNYPDFAGQELVSVSDLSNQLQAAITHNQEIDNRFTANEGKKTTGMGIEREIASLNERITHLIAERDGKVAELNDLKASYKSEKDIIANLVKQNTDDIRQRIDQSELINGKIRANETYRKASEEFQSFKTSYASLTTQIDELIASRKSLVANANLPVAGLTVDDSGIRFHDVPLAQCSDGEKLMIGVAISMALNPTLRVIRIKDGSLLDKKNRAILREIIHEKDFQLWIETVGGDASSGILIEEGKVAGVKLGECNPAVQNDQKEIEGKMIPCKRENTSDWQDPPPVSTPLPLPTPVTVGEPEIPEAPKSDAVEGW